MLEIFSSTLFYANFRIEAGRFFSSPFFGPVVLRPYGTMTRSERIMPGHTAISALLFSREQRFGGSLRISR